MRFREYYILEVKVNDVFDKSFDKFYKKGFFGNIDEELVRKEQKIWYQKLVKFIIEKNQKELNMALGSIENKLSRHYFSSFTGFNINHKTKADVLEIIEKYVTR